MTWNHQICALKGSFLARLLYFNCRPGWISFFFPRRRWFSGSCDNLISVTIRLLGVRRNALLKYACACKSKYQQFKICGIFCFPVITCFMMNIIWTQHAAQQLYSWVLYSLKKQMNISITPPWASYTDLRFWAIWHSAIVLFTLRTTWRTFAASRMKGWT